MTQHTKECSVCGVVKPLAEFHSDKRINGYRAACKVCRQAKVREWNAKHPTQHRARTHAWRKANPAKRITQDKRYRLSNPNRRKAHQAVKDAVSSGKLIKPSTCFGCCAETPKERLGGHHYAGYGKPLAVVWLCDPCHKHIHRRMSKEA